MNNITQHETKEDDQRQRCPRCRVNLPVSHFKQKRCGNYQKQCMRCNAKAREFHHRTKNKPKSKPKNTQSLVCEHGIRRTGCKPCGGVAICEHSRQRSRCKECKGGSICEHGKQRPSCKQCGGSAFCEHGKQRSRCKQCHVHSKSKK